MPPDIDATFWELAGDVVHDEANALLDKQLIKAQLWIRQQHKAGKVANLREIILQMQRDMTKEPQRINITTALCAAALWRLLEKDGKL